MKKAITVFIVIAWAWFMYLSWGNIYRLYQYNKTMDSFVASAITTAQIKLLAYYQKNSILPYDLNEIDIKNPMVFNAPVGARFLEIFYDNAIDLKKRRGELPIVFATYNPMASTQKVIRFDAENKQSPFCIAEISTEEFKNWGNAFEEAIEGQRNQLKK